MTSQIALPISVSSYNHRAFIQQINKRSRYFPLNFTTVMKKSPNVSINVLMSLKKSYCKITSVLFLENQHLQKEYLTV